MDLSKIIRAHKSRPSFIFSQKSWTFRSNAVVTISKTVWYYLELHETFRFFVNIGFSLIVRVEGVSELLSQTSWFDIKLEFGTAIACTDTSQS